MIDAGGNGMIKLVDLDKGMRDIINLPVLFKSKPVMVRAFIAAKQIVRSQSNYSSDYVQFAEFRYILKYLRQYFEYWIALKYRDNGTEKVLSTGEFQSLIPLMQKWGIDMRNPQQTWRDLDTFGVGKIFFADFTQWAIVSTLQIDDNQDVPE